MSERLDKLGIKLPNELGIMIMDTVLELVTETLSELKPGDPTLLSLIEFYPRSEDFADRILSCSISPNDPDDPGGWPDEEITKWPPKQDQFSQDYGRNFGEMGGGQGFSLRFKLDFRLYYSQIGLSRYEAVKSAKVILARITTAILRDRTKLRGLKDDFGSILLVWHKAVKSSEVIPAGSAEETYVKASIKLQFEVYRE